MRFFEDFWLTELPEEIVPSDDLVVPTEDLPDLRSERVQIEEPEVDALPFEEPAS
jgi:hypothetical protein